MLIQEAKRFQYLAGLIKEDEQSAELDSFFGKLGDEIADKMEDKLEDKNLQNEIGVSTAILALCITTCAPVVASYVGKTAKYVFGELGVEKGEAFGEWLEHNAHVLESKLKAPFKAIVGKFINDPQKADTVAEALYAIMLAGLGLSAGISFMDSIKHGNVSQAALNTLKMAIKGKEIKDYVTSVMPQALTA
jgi:hypothetical protein